MTKYSLDQNFLVDVIYKEDLLPEDNTLIDVAYSYNWRKVRQIVLIKKIFSKNLFYFQTSPMRFYYRIYQKTKVLTRKRKKKSTKTNNKSHPAKKRKTDAPATLDKLPHNGMEVDDKVTENQKAPKVSPKINGDGAKDKVNGVKDTKKSSPPPVIKSSAPKVSFGGVETKPVKSVTISSNVSYSNSNDRKSLDKVPGKPKPLSPILKNVSSDKSSKLPPSLPKNPPVVTETKSKSNTSVTQNSIKSNNSSSKKPVTSGNSASTTSSNKANVTQSKPNSNNSSVTNLGGKTDKKVTFPQESSVKDSLKEKVTQFPSNNTTKVTNTKVNVSSVKENGKLLTNGVKQSPNADSNANNKSSASDKAVSKMIPETKKQSSDSNQVVEISVEVSASDIKKVLEKKKAEKDAKLITNGEERLFSNYSIVDQLKKSNAAANLANQKKQASMMDFTRSSEAFSGPKVPPNVQGLQPKQNSGSDSNALAAIVHSLAQKQQSLNQKIQAATSNINGSSPNGKSASEKSEKTSDAKTSNSESGEKLKQTEQTGAKTLGTIVGAAKTSSQDKHAVTSMGPKLPISTSIKPITKDSHTNPTSVESNGSKGQQLINFYKNNSSTTGSNTSSTTTKTNTSSAQEASKNAESLTKNIPAGTTVTVKTVDTNKLVKAPSPPSSKNSSLRMNMTTSTNAKLSTSSNVQSSPRVTSNPFTAGAAGTDPMSQAALMMAAQVHQQQIAHAQYLNFSNQVAAAAALSSQMEIAAAVAAARITQSPMTTLAFTKPVSSTEDVSRYNLKIPQPGVNRHSPSSVSNFGTSRLQVKVNSDSPKTSLSTSKDETKSSTTPPSNKVATGIHSMPAMIPFHDMKKVQAIPKSVSNSNRNLLNKTPTNAKTPNSPSKTPSIDSNPYKNTSTLPVKQISSEKNSGKISPSSNPFKPVTQVNSLKKLVADLNSVKEKRKAENLLNTLKKNSENSLLSESKKAFLGLDQNISEKPKEVTSS